MGLAGAIISDPSCPASGTAIIAASSRMTSQFGLDFGTLVGMISAQASVKIDTGRDGGIGRRVGLRMYRVISEACC